MDELAGSGTLGEDAFIQLGSCNYQPKHARFEKYLSFGDVCANIQKSSTVITHAGAGSTLVCLQQRKHPIMVPRRAQHKEHVDEHQVPFARKLKQAGLATVVMEMDELTAAIASVKGRVAPEDALGAARELVGWLNGYWQSLSGGTAARA